MKNPREYSEQKNKDCLDSKNKSSLRLQVFDSLMNPHFVFNALNAIQSFIISEDKKRALSYFSILGKLIRYCLGNMDKDAVALQNEINALMWYLKLQKLRYTHLIDYNLKSNVSVSDQINVPTFVLLSILETKIESITNSVFESFFLDILVSSNKQNVYFTVTISLIKQNKIWMSASKYQNKVLKWKEYINSIHFYNEFDLKVDIHTENPGLLKETIKVSFPGI